MEYLAKEQKGLSYSSPTSKILWLKITQFICFWIICVWLISQYLVQVKTIALICLVHFFSSVYNWARQQASQMESEIIRWGEVMSNLWVFFLLTFWMGAGLYLPDWHKMNL